MLSEKPDSVTRFMPLVKDNKLKKVVADEHLLWLKTVTNARIGIPAQ